MVLRFLLDHNFQPPQFDVHALDRTVIYEPLAQWRPDFAATTTPDWIVHLQAHQDGFDGVVRSRRLQEDIDQDLASHLVGSTVGCLHDRDEDPQHEHRDEHRGHRRERRAGVAAQRARDLAQEEREVHG
ncbi:MAG: hypothetical protein KY433_12270 [Actinobacteria bacterium]|nr:hypothetical protein [Actinomycetota bacterium]